VLELGIYDIDKIDGCGLTVDQLTMVYDELNQLSLSQRADLPGMEAGRAGVILPAMRILLKLLHQLKATSVTVTVRGARYGILTALKD
jgi:exopolyphosphatase/guanosine-5'-triphosphate,3'-diphosphate pyrophosphatase